MNQGKKLEVSLDHWKEARNLRNVETLPELGLGGSSLGVSGEAEDNRRI
jgi:hypothetical protein